MQDQRSVLEEVGAIFLEKTPIILDQNVGDKRPLTMAEIRDPDHLPNRAAEARQDFQRAMAAKRAKTSEPAQSVRIS